MSQLLRSLMIGFLFAAARIVYGEASDDQLKTAAAAAQEFLDTDDDERHRELADDLAQFDDRIDDVLQCLRQRDYPDVEPGYYPEQRFTTAELREKHPDDLLYIHVPKSYRSDRPTGLIVVMHGGGATTDRDAPHYCIRPLDDEDDEECSAMGSLFDKAGLIAVGPSAPWNERSYYRWCLREADEYLADVILECKRRFQIDDDRVFLLGHSMGGFGAFHHIQRQPDRFAAVIAHAGSWDIAYWPIIRGTRFCFINGVADAEKGERWHYTDIAYARQTDRLLTEHQLDYVYYEHPGGHDLFHGKPYVAKFLHAARDLRRDLCFRHIAVATPVGYSRYHASPARHNRWLTMNALRPGKIEFDELVSNDEDDLDFDDWELEHRTSRWEGSALEGWNRGDNRLEIETQHVARFTVWLHPHMIDVRRPVVILVDGQVRFEGMVQPSLVTALESYERRRDWGLVYPMKVVIDLDGH